MVYMDVLKDNPKMMIWVVNPDEEAVNPLIGNPKDKKIPCSRHTGNQGWTNRKFCRL